MLGNVHCKCKQQINISNVQSKWVLFAVHYKCTLEMYINNVG